MILRREHLKNTSKNFVENNINCKELVVKNIKNNTSNEKIAIKVSFYSILANSFLSIFKLLAGVIGKSGAMISDAVHSMSDVFSTIIVIIGVKLANKKPDKDHQYGHERLECIAATILAMTLILVGIGIGISGAKKIIDGNYANLAVPGILALIAAVISIITKEVMFWYTRSAAKKIDSSALMADAWHHRSDSLSSIGSFIGILGARLGFPILDPIASLVICIFILKAGYDIFIDATKKVIDEACDDKTVNQIQEIALLQEGVVKVDMIKTRLFASKAYIDLEISVDGDKTVREAHEIAQKVHDEIEEKIEFVKHCMVHVNPA